MMDSTADAITRAYLEVYAETYKAMDSAEMKVWSKHDRAHEAALAVAAVVGDCLSMTSREE